MAIETRFLPEARALIGDLADALDPFDASVFRRMVLDHAPAEEIAEELGSTAEVVRVRWEFLYGAISRALGKPRR